MENFTVRLLSLDISNIKNVEKGSLCLPKSKIADGFSSEADVVGIYGQNGSGKTTVVQVLNLFKSIAQGEPLWINLRDYISTESNEASLSFCFAIQTAENKKYKITYSCSLKKQNDKNKGAAFIGERLSVSKENDVKWNKTKIWFEYNAQEENSQLFSPKDRYDNIVKKEQQNVIALTVIYKLAFQNNTSFLFSKEFYKILAKSEEKELFEIIKTMRKYAQKKLTVVLNSHSGIISVGSIIPLSIAQEFRDFSAFGDIVINQKEPMVVDFPIFKIIEKILINMDVVIQSLVPELSIKIKNYGEQLLENGHKGIRFELFSERHGKQIPIRYESEGIRKILSVLNLIIAMYNDKSMLVAIDELDAGIFEVLLGKLLNVIKDSGKGQLIFTSHNLRPLETLEKSNVIFTTANSKKRYIHLKNIRPSNNLRDCYIRALNLGGQEEDLALPIKSSSIRRALRKAGSNV